MSSLATARFQWAEGKRQLDAAGVDTARSRHLLILVDAVLTELPKRIGQTFTLAELARVYEGAEDWVREIIVVSLPPRPRAGIKDTVLVQDAAFWLYAQGASDYRP
ncbi:MAG TPA: hypothetical protein VH281_07960 [Gaiellaceae bacterium]|jgi:hypothetical protein